jgi:hypothetical protein
MFWVFFEEWYADKGSYGYTVISEWRTDTEAQYEADKLNSQMIETEANRTDSYYVEC